MHPPRRIRQNASGLGPAGPGPAEWFLTPPPLSSTGSSATPPPLPPTPDPVQEHLRKLDYLEKKQYRKRQAACHNEAAILAAEEERMRNADNSLEKALCQSAAEANCRKLWFCDFQQHTKEKDFAKLDAYLDDFESLDDEQIRFLERVAKKYKLDLVEYAEQVHGIVFEDDDCDEDAEDVDELEDETWEEEESDVDQESERDDIADVVDQTAIIEERICKEEATLEQLKKDFARLKWHERWMKKAMKNYIEITERKLADLRKQRG